ncbi:unnamed protein product [Parnassius mnemosyne]|uniref:Reverse transcriptase domain-containing protein n=1 Tax=Parnassius mnemosyne TaxID=213953 RepID=A0AAV1LG92_9NEOP
MRYLEDHQLISDRQYGFRRGRAAGDLLGYLTHRWAEAVESKGEALAVSLDIAKAFDRVWHKALLSKLPSYGLPEKLCNWITSFLADRSIKVVVDGACSDYKSINAGVPQGCVLSPTLFLLHINDMLQTSNIHCYADDSTGDALYTGRANISREIVAECRNKHVSEVETLLNKVSDWGRLNLVQFNPQKTQVCAFTTKRTPLLYLLSFKALPLLPQPISGSLVSTYRVTCSFVVTWKRRPNWPLKSLACSAERDSISCRHTACNFTRRRFGLTWNTVPISGQGLPSASSFHLTASSAERFESSTTEFFPIGLTHWHCVEMLHLCIFYRFYHGECREELFGLIPAAQFHHRTSRQNSRYHPYHLDDWRSTTVRFRSFLPRTTSLWNRLPPAIFPDQYLRLRDLQEKSLLLFKRPATHLRFPWCCSCSWAAEFYDP